MIRVIDLSDGVPFKDRDLAVLKPEKPCKMVSRCTQYGCLMYISRLATDINLSPEMEQYLQSKIGTGYYSNASEVVRDAIRRMRDEDEKLAALRSAVKVGDEQLERGEGIPTPCRNTWQDANGNPNRGSSRSSWNPVGMEYMPTLPGVD
ncbi:MAG: type II toxin-antitoxin system ParD family antitoxin [Methylococcales bacterium]